MGIHSVSRIGHVLKRRHEALNSWPAVRQEIYEANGQKRDSAIHRRTLVRLASDEPNSAQLRISQLIALNQYMIWLGEDAFLTKHETLIDSIAESLDVNILIAARKYELLDDLAVSRWDFGAYTRLMLTRLIQLRVRVWEVFDSSLWINNDLRLLDAPNIAIGSPLGNPGSEHLLCEMLGVLPYEKCAVDSLPFFVVRANRDAGNKSAFIRTRKESRKFDAKKKVKLDEEKRAFVVDGKMYKSNDEDDYAMLIAQRRPSDGKVQLVFFGLSGRATHQMGDILQSGQPRETVPPLKSGQKRPPILVALYQVHLSTDAHGEGPVVIGSSPIGEPTLIRYIDDEWQFDEPLDAAS